MIEQCIVLTNTLGLHLRPATMFAAIAQRYSSQIQVTYEGKAVTGKSPIGLLQLQAQQGCSITVCAEGMDEQEAIVALVQLVRNEFCCIQ